MAQKGTKMRSDAQLDLRRKLVRLEKGEKIILDGDIDAITKVVRAFERGDRWFSVILVAEGIEVMRAPGKIKKAPKWTTNIEPMTVGETYLFRVAGVDFPKIRSAVSTYQQATGKRFSCTVEDGGLLVRRIPATPEEIAKYGEDLVIDARSRPRTSVYGLELLATQRVLEIPGFSRSRVDNLRTSATAKARRMGWKLSVKSTIWGVTITRVDELAPPDKPPGGRIIGADT